jgi:hypothetical protein
MTENRFMVSGVRFQVSEGKEQKVGSWEGEKVGTKRR